VQSSPTALDLLRATHTFPGPFVFKAIGRNESQFAERILAAARTVLTGHAEPPFTSRITPNGQHIAVTLEPQVDSAEQVLEVYAQLQHVAGLELLL
jgi:putative lipoic acid-binding regulatory protein